MGKGEAHPSTDLCIKAPSLVKRRIVDAVIAGQFLRIKRGLMLLHYPDNLLFSETGSLHRLSSQLENRLAFGTGHFRDQVIRDNEYQQTRSAEAESRLFQTRSRPIIGEFPSASRPWLPPRKRIFSLGSTKINAPIALPNRGKTSNTVPAVLLRYTHPACAPDRYIRDP